MIPFQSDIERDYHAWVGRYITAWAGAETMLNSLVHVLYRSFQAEKLEPEVPIALARKLRLVRRIFEQNPDLTHEREEALGIVGFLQTDAEYRHDVVHGLQVNLAQGEPFYALMQRPLDRARPMGEQRSIKVFTQDLVTRYDEVGRAGFFLGMIGYRLSKNNLQALEAKHAAALENLAQSKRPGSPIS